MPSNKNEQLVCEAINTMLQHKAKLGLDDANDFKNEESHSSQFAYEYADDLFAIKSASLTHHDGVCAAFGKVHGYMHITDPLFPRAMEHEMRSQGIPKNEQDKALDYIPQIIKELDVDNEQDLGWNPKLDEIVNMSRPHNE